MQMKKAMQTEADQLTTDNLVQFLKSLDESEIDRLANLMVKLSSSAGRVLPDAMNRDGLTGKLLIAPIMYDLRHLAKYTIDNSSNYLEILTSVARRHGITKINPAKPAEIERQIQLRYIDALRPNALRPSAEAFTDLGSSELLRKIGYLLPPFGPISYAMSPDWRTVTAIVLEIAALRRTALVRHLASNLEF